MTEGGAAAFIRRCVKTCAGDAAARASLSSRVFSSALLSVKRHLKSRRVERIEKLNVTWRPRLSLGFRTTGSHSWAHRRLPAGGVISAPARNYNIFDPPHPPRLHAAVHPNRRVVEQVRPQFKVLAINTKTSSTQDFSVHTRAAAKATAFLRLRSRSASAMRPYASRLRYPPYAHTVAKT